MSFDFDTCPHCGQRVLKGAMRCTGCGKILKSPEEQLASIKKFKESKKRFNTGKLLKFIIFLLAAGIIYHYYSEEIIEFIRNIFAQ